MDEGVKPTDPQTIIDGFAGETAIYFAEDDVAIGKVFIELISEVFRDRISKIVWIQTRNDICLKLDDEDANVWITDLNFPDGALDVESMGEALLARTERTGLILTSGYPDKIAQAQKSIGEKNGKGRLRAEYLVKAFGLDVFCLALTRVLDHIDGKEVVEALDVVELPEAESLEKVPDLFELVKTLKEELEYLLDVACRGSYAAFKVVWNELFPRGEGSKMEVFKQVLDEIDGASFVLRICVHDVNNVLHRWNGGGPTPEQWEKAQLELKALIDRSLKPFAEYVEDPNMEFPFWRNQDVGTVLKHLKSEFSDVECEVDENVAVFCPAGSLWSMIRTFSSNFNKLKRRYSLEGDLSLRITRENNELVFVMEDSLREFDEDQLKLLFDQGIRSDMPGADMGTGLSSTAELAELSGGSITSYHFRSERGIWVQKSPGGQPQELVPHQVPMAPAGTTKFFELRLSIAAQE
jgi:hypothetical protein